MLSNSCETEGMKLAFLSKMFLLLFIVCQPSNNKHVVYLKCLITLLLEKEFLWVLLFLTFTQ